jgi:hypothetical protein
VKGTVPFKASDRGLSCPVIGEHLSPSATNSAAGIDPRQIWCVYATATTTRAPRRARPDFRSTQKVSIIQVSSAPSRGS